MQNEYTQRYGENWPQISQFTRRKTRGLCCFPGCDREATEVHHCLYHYNGQFIANTRFERLGAGSFFFPLCPIHHSVNHRDGAHHPRNWVKHSKNPALYNQNTIEYYKKLREGYIMKTK